MRYNKAKMKKYIYFNTGFLAALLLLFLGAAYWLRSDIQRKAAQILQQKEEIAHTSALVGSLLKLKEQEPRADRYIQTIEALVPTKDALLDLGKWIERTGSIYHVHATFAFKGNATPPTNDQFGFIGISINAEGKYSDVMRFLRTIEGTAPKGFFIGIDRTSFTTEGGVSKFLLNGKAFFRGEEEHNSS
ncbi:hypothetical protein D6779_00900 [Candidatus Parcubacteria bacterium]|nr:MAG: hypothetical protein D6779_00900 [Candidatus Parcubacteria bacterium]